ncbi:MAG: FKBP-type peptidyl-prolyl cis-trans isomerase N-terminal domain-containing protein [SAR324 cluster bacterium]
MVPHRTRRHAALTIALILAMAGLLVPVRPASADPAPALSSDNEKASYAIGTNVGASLKRDGETIDQAALVQGMKDGLSDDKAKSSYAIGANVGASLKRQGVDIDLAALGQGVKDALAGAESKLSQQEVHAVMARLQQNMQAKHDAVQKAAGEKNKKDGEAFLAKNKKEPGVKTTASGLEYKIVKEGTGRTPTLADTVTANYRGTLLDGTEFDSSYKRGEPAKFPVSGVIPGWTEVLQQMKVGSKYKVFIPSNLAYGEKGAGQQIGPNATLIFEIELLDAKQD